MQTTALPLRIHSNGKLETQDALDAVLMLVSAMARTAAPPVSARTAESWLTWFGLLEQFEDAASRPHQEHERLKDAINLALRRLGDDSYSVHSVVTGPLSGDGNRSFDMTFTRKDGQPSFGRVTPGNAANADARGSR